MTYTYIHMYILRVFYIFPVVDFTLTSIEEVYREELNVKYSFLKFKGIQTKTNVIYVFMMRIHGLMPEARACRQTMNEVARERDIRLFRSSHLARAFSLLLIYLHFKRSSLHTDVYRYVYRSHHN